MNSSSFRPRFHLSITDVTALAVSYAPRRATAALLACGIVFLVAGCETKSPGDSNGRVAVVDMVRVEKETGRDILRFRALDQLQQQKQMELAQLKHRFDVVAESEHQKLGPMASADANAKFEAMTQDMGMKMNAAIEQARQDVSRANLDILGKFRDEVGAIALKIAETRGMTVVVDKGAGVVGCSADSDITTAVLDEMRKNPPPPAPLTQTPGTSGSSGEAPPGTEIPGASDQSAGPAESPFAPGLLAPKPKPTTAPATAPNP